MTVTWRGAAARAVPALMAVLVVLVIGALASSGSAAEATTAELLRDPTRYAGQFLSVRGTMGTPQTIPSRRAPVTVFDLTDGGALVKVMTRIRPACFPGSTVTVEGRFDSLKNVEGMTFINVLDASLVRCR